jgi:hypothetical protein
MVGTRATARDRPYHGRCGSKSHPTRERPNGYGRGDPCGFHGEVCLKRGGKRTRLVGRRRNTAQNQRPCLKRGGKRTRLVGAWVVGRKGGDALCCASPSSCSRARLPPSPRATQASPPRTTQPPPLQVRSCFRGDIAKTTLVGASPAPTFQLFQWVGLPFA